MPDSSNLKTQIVRNDGAQSFTLKCDSAERNQKYNFVAKGILSAAGDIAGKDLSMGFENYTLQGSIQETDPSTYPNLRNVDTSQYPHATAKEMALAEATRAWGPDANGGFDVLHWGPRERTGMISQYSATENAEQKMSGKYSFTLEWTHANIYLEDEPE